MFVWMSPHHTTAQHRTTNLRTELGKFRIQAMCIVA